MDLTLVPFGYSEAEDRLVDVHQVQSGKLCDCICPSCKAPLIARKGSKKVWHFAHDSSSEVLKELEKCSYSFFVAARMMARQLIGDSLEVALPGYELYLDEKVPLSNRLIHVSERVTKPRQVQLTDVDLDAEINGQRFDILGYVDGHALAFIFTHPGRDDLHRLENYDYRKSGIVAISLDALKDEFRRLQTPNYSYGKILSDYISNDSKSKKWIYHPRQQHAKDKAKLKLKIALEKEKKAASKTRGQSGARSAFQDKLFVGLKNLKTQKVNDQRFRYICRMCNSQWAGVGNADATCKICGESLLVSRVEIDS